MDVSVVLPCLNEEKGVGVCVNKIQEVFRGEKLDGEVIVVDNGCTDDTVKVVKSLGFENVKIVPESKRGYGSAYLAGFKAASGKFVIMGDADNTYDFNEIPKFVNSLREGHDFVIGNRFGGKMEKNTMPWLHQYVGNPMLSGLFRMFFSSKVRDVHCGMRAMRREAIDKLNLKTTGMEFASEMVIEAIRKNLKIKEIPINYHRRVGESKLHSFSDGWRHLRFMLMYAPDYLFLIPGALFFLIGLLLIWLFRSNVVYGCFSLILGYQIVSLGIFTKIYMKSVGLTRESKLINYLARTIKFETGIIIGVVLLLVSFLISQQRFFDYLMMNFGLASHGVIIIALTIAVIGVQTMFSAFLISILLVERTK
jgi:glycosyltransferase involved in cell wall biosynthesis